MYTLMKKDWQKNIGFIVMDMIGLETILFITCWIYHRDLSAFLNPFYLNIALIVLIISLIFCWFSKSFQSLYEKTTKQKFFFLSIRSILIFAMAACFIYMIQRSVVHFIEVFFLVNVLCFVESSLLWIVWRNYNTHHLQKGNKRSLLLVTVAENHKGCSIQNYYKMYHIAGVALMDVNRKGELFQEALVVASKDDLFSYVSRQWIDEVFIDLPWRYYNLCQEIVNHFNQMGIVTHVKLVNRNEKSGRKQLIEQWENDIVLTTSMNFVTAGQVFLKRTMDIIGSLIGLVLTGIFYLILAPIIKIQSPGPVLFSQIRIGRNGKRFKIYKFRTMYLDAEERKKDLLELNRIKDGHMFKLSFDPRVIGNKILPNGTQKVGFMNLCRQLSLDEFPQFINVLKGEMSLVGTRPPTVEEYETYEFHHHARLACKPGLTGMWQVNGRSNITDFEEVVKLDTKYINEWSIGLDLQILLKTIVKVLKKEGAI